MKTCDSVIPFTAFASTPQAFKGCINRQRMTKDCGGPGGPGGPAQAQRMRRNLQLSHGGLKAWRPQLDGASLCFPLICTQHHPTILLSTPVGGDIAFPNSPAGPLPFPGSLEWLRTSVWKVVLNSEQMALFVGTTL